MNNRITRLLLVLSLIAVILAACGGSSTSTEADESAAVDSSTETAQVEATEAPAEEVPAEEAPAEEVPAEEAPAEQTPTETEQSETGVKFLVTDTKQEFSYDNEGNPILFPAEGEALYGQDGQYIGLEPSFQDNGDPSTGSGQVGTVSDLVTGLLWEKTPTFETYQHEDAVTYCENLETGGYDDWRMPTIKELYSLADYRGELLLDDVSTPYIDTDYFDFEYPAGRQYAGQYWSSTRYSIPPNSETEDQQKYFGFNFADGHIKGYGTAYTFDGTPLEGGLAPGMYVRCVSGEEDVYGVNQFVDNGDGTVTDTATGLIWQQTDDGQTRNWEEALAYAENLELADYDDWRLPNAKELQSIVDYGVTEIPAINEEFFTLTNSDSYFWTSTTHGDFKYQGIYIAFGPAWSIPVRSDSDEYIDEHGAGAQRSDPKTGDPDEYNNNLTSENASDLYRIYDYVLAVRNVDEQPAIQEDTGTLPEKTGTPIEASSGQGTESGPGDQAPDLAAAAETLGITEQELLDALGDPPPDFDAAAATLNITVEELEHAMAGESSAPPAASNGETEAPIAGASTAATYNLVDSGQGLCYNSDGEKIDCPAEGEAFYGQDAQYAFADFDFTDNGDGTVTDNVTGLIWEKTPDTTKRGWADAQTYCEELSLAGSDDWRTPSLKELFSISDFGSGWPYIDTETFDLITDSGQDKLEQYWADYYMVDTSEAAPEHAFGVNHATGHIKAYPDGANGGGGPAGKYVRCVLGDDYLINDFVDNGDGAITDNATGMMWAQDDNGEGMDWVSALAYAAQMNGENYLGYSDWRVPSIKELQSIVDYSGVYPAIDPNYFNITDDDSYFWTSTSAYFSPMTPGYYYAWYVAFGYAVGPDDVDSHGAGAVRFDTKAEGGPAGEEPERVFNYVRLVRGGDFTLTPEGDPTADDSVSMVESAEGGPAGGPPQGGPQGSEGQPQGGPQDGSQDGEGQPQMPDFAAAAEQLGVTEAALIDALGDPPPDLEAAAEKLGVPVEALENALNGE